MSDGWDPTVNWDNITPQERQRILDRQRSREMEQRRLRLGLVEIPELDNRITRQNFSYYSEISEDEMDDRYRPDNRLLWFCHACGANGYKVSRLKELFKCYYCRGRNVTVCRAGEASMALRGLTINPGVNMQALFATRTERLRSTRRQRRLNAQSDNESGNTAVILDSIPSAISSPF
jgi:hypothetical protein